MQGLRGVLLTKNGSRCGKRLNWVGLMLLGLLLGASLPHSDGQTTSGQISGSVLDASGSLIVGASVTATNIETGFQRKTVSNSTGNYVLNLLPPGKYQIVFEKAGFSVRTDENIVLTVDESLTLDAPLATGSTNETVAVQADVQGLQTSSSQLGSVVGEKEIQDLPLNGRNFSQMLLLTPGATPISVSQGAALAQNDSTTFAIPGTDYANPAINGQENRSQEYMYDGVINTDFRSTAYGALPILDTIQEFKLVSQPDDPEYGGVTGGVVNVVSKSGTNQFHGSAWEYLKNNYFDARDSFADAGQAGPAPFRQNEFGVSVGGPVRIPKIYNGRDKTHFFFGYEGWKYLNPNNTYYWEPTQAELNGDFSHSVYVIPGTTTPQPIYDPASTTMGTDSNGNPILVRQQFSYNGVANVIPPSRIDPAIQSYLKYYLDQANVTGNANGNVINRNPNINNDTSFSARLDQVISSKDSFWLRYSDMQQLILTPAQLHVNTTTKFLAPDEGFGYTHIFSPKILVDVRGGYLGRPFNPAWQVENSLGNGGINSAMSTDLAFGPPQLGFDQFYTGTSLGGLSVRKDLASNLSGDLMWEHGKHVLKVGGGYTEQWRTQLQTSQGDSFDIFQTAEPITTGAAGTAPSPTGVAPNTGNALASALLSLPQSASFSFPSGGFKSRMLSWDLFAGDSWKVNTRLTVNLGIRFDHLDRPTLPFGVDTDFDFDNGIYYIGGGKMPPACAVQVVSPCIPGPSTNAAADLAAVIGYDGSVAGSHIQINPNQVIGPNPIWVDFGPRLGFAYRGPHETAIHGGFGILYDDLSGVGQTFSNSVGAWPSSGNSSPHYNQTLTTSTSTTFEQSQSGVTLGLPSSTPFNNFGFYSDPLAKIPYSEEYNLGVDAAVKKDVLKVTYVGSEAHRLDYGGICNVARVPGDLSTIPYPYEIPTFFDQNIANSHYNALQVELDHPYSQGFTYRVSYTLSRSIDNSSGRFGLAEGGPGGNATTQEYYNPSNSIGVSAFDIPQFLTVYGLYDLPIGRGKQYLNTGLPAVLLGNWQVDTISQLRSGQPYTMNVNGDIAQVGSLIFSTGRPNYVPGVNPNPAHPTYKEWYNPAAFSVPVKSYGDVPRDSLRSSHVITSDFSVLKNFAVSDQMFVQFRAEAFNIMNIQNYSTPDPNISDPTAGVISSLAAKPRQLQFALRFNF